MSVIDELSIGTRIARPLSLPLSSGKTSATAVAEPVEVGARLSIPLRARLKSCENQTECRAFMNALSDHPPVKSPAKVGADGTDFLSFTISTRDCVPLREERVAGENQHEERVGGESQHGHFVTPRNHEDKVALLGEAHVML